MITRLGNRIRELRLKTHSNHEKFAFEHDISRTVYGRWENGADMKFSSILTVLEAHNMSLVEFFSEGFEESK